MARTSFIPEQGERALVVGQTGSGKTGFALWLLERIPFAPIIMYDLKVEPKFDLLGKPKKKGDEPSNVVVNTVEEAHEYIDDPSKDYIIVRPPEQLLGEPDALDEMLWYHYLHFHQCPAFLDECDMFQRNGRAGKGLTSLLKRGRSKGITTIMCSQRPVRIDRSCVTESSKAYIFRLSDKKDRQRIDDLIPNFSELPMPPKFGFYFFETGDDAPQLMAPIKLDDKLNTGYVDTVQPVETAGNLQGNTSKQTKHTWV
jgi:hypothetical protein